MPLLPTKSSLRAALKPILNSISQANRTLSSHQISEHLLRSERYTSASTILAYAALPSELDLDPFINTALEDGKRVCIPAIDWARKTMQPAVIENLDTDLETGRYGVRSPRDRCPLVEPQNIDLILVPGLGFDRDLNRLGRGAGFYDRMIESLIETLGTASTRPVLVGVCFNCQIVERVPTQAHDFPMDRIITQTGFIEPV